MLPNALSAAVQTDQPNPLSHQWHDRAQQAIVNGGQAHRKSYKYTLRGGPEYIERAEGAYFYDVDGRQFIDYLMGYGPIVLGHADQRITDAVSDQLSRGTIYSLESPRVIELAERLCQHIPCAERATFLVGGSSATTAAVRCARVVTGRERIVRCGYHGWFDWCFPGDAGAPPAKPVSIPVAMYDLDALRDTFMQHRDTIACFILEAYLGRWATDRLRCWRACFV